MGVPITQEQMFSKLINLAKARGLTVKEYLEKYDPKTDSLKQFTDYQDTGMDIVVTAKRKTTDPPIIHVESENARAWILLAVFAFCAIIILFTLKPVK